MTKLSSISRFVLLLVRASTQSPQFSDAMTALRIKLAVSHLARISRPPVTFQVQLLQESKTSMEFVIRTQD